jgi:hypothetical protein
MVVQPQRLNRQLRRRTDVVGILADQAGTSHDLMHQIPGQGYPASTSARSQGGAAEGGGAKPNRVPVT